MKRKLPVSIGDCTPVVKSVTNPFPGKVVLPIILTDFGLPRKLLWIIAVCLHENCRNVCASEHLSDTFPINTDLNPGLFYCNCLSVFLQCLSEGGMTVIVLN
jgi:hypothetical protein